MNRSPRTECPDCGSRLEPIQLIDYGDQGTQITPPQYAAGDAKRSFWKGIATEGTVSARMCGECGRILLYGEPKQPG